MEDKRDIENSENRSANILFYWAHVIYSFDVIQLNYFYKKDHFNLPAYSLQYTENIIIQCGLNLDEYNLIVKHNQTSLN